MNYCQYVGILLNLRSEIIVSQWKILLKISISLVGRRQKPVIFKVTAEENTGKSRRLYIESYGCQMNFSDSEIVASIMKETGFDTTSDYKNADVIFLNTCSIRDKAEQTVRKG